MQNTYLWIECKKSLLKWIQLSSEGNKIKLFGCHIMRHFPPNQPTQTPSRHGGKWMYRKGNRKRTPGTETELVWVTSPETHRQTNTERSIFLIRLWALSSDFQPIWQTGEKDSWVEGQLVTAGGLWLDFFISRCQGPLKHGHMQPAWTHTVMARTVCKHKHINTHIH